MTARGCGPSAFIVFECLKTPMKHKTRVCEIASQSCIINLLRTMQKLSLKLASYAEYKFLAYFWYCFSVIIGLCCQIFQQCHKSLKTVIVVKAEHFIQLIQFGHSYEILRCHVFGKSKQADCFYCFRVFGNPDETRSTSF